MRLKNVVRPLELTVADIARAPIFIHQWKDKQEFGDGEFVGTSAQYWLGVLPQAVRLRQWYEMDYGKAAMASIVTVARETESLGQMAVQLKREVVWLKREVVQLKRENEELRKLLKAS